jgi:uncharacterized membrane protein
MWAAFMLACFVIWIPIIGWLVGAALAIFNLVAFVKCLMGEFWEIPLIGEQRKKINL